MKFKKILAGFVAVMIVICSGIIPEIFSGVLEEIVAEAAETSANGQCGDNVFWELSDDGVLTISGTGKMYDGINFSSYCDNINSLVIKDGVTTISNGAFSYCKNLKSITIPDSIVRIEEAAFGWCINLVSVDIPDSVTYIGQEAFAFCKGLENVTISKNIVSIENYTFTYCESLKNIVLPDGITSIGYDVFTNCICLESITVPSSISYIPSNTFGGLKNLKDIYYGGTENKWNELNNQKYGHFTDSIPQNCVIHYNSTDENSTKYCLIYGSDVEIFSKNDTIENIIGNDDAFVYKPKLAHILSVLSASVYDDITDVEQNYRALGFKGTVPYNCDKVNQYFIPDNVGYVFGYKKLDNGTTELLITVRGTAGHPLTLDAEWRSDFYSGWNASGNSLHYHNGFYAAYSKIYVDLMNYLSDILHTDFDDQNIRYIITGHSRGAAVSNILAHVLGNGIPKKNIYSYNFACPNTVCMNSTEVGDDRNIFNIGNCEDGVPYLPGGTTSFWSTPVSWNLFTFGDPRIWRKFGISYLYSENWDKFTGMNLLNLSTAHNQDNYVTFMRNEYPLYGINSPYKTEYNANKIAEKNLTFEALKNRRSSFEVIMCPVDVTIKDQNGTILATVINDEISYINDGFDKVNVWTDDGHKYITYNEDEKINIEVTAFDDGVMSVVRGNSVNGNVISSAAEYRNISINEGKSFSLSAQTDDQSIFDRPIISGDGEEILPSDTFLLGDVNKNRKLDIADAVSLQKYLVRSEEYDSIQFATTDMDGDGKVNVFDFIMLKRTILNDLGKN